MGDLLAFLSFGSGIPETVALASVALIGYLFGRSQLQTTEITNHPEELLRAVEISHRLESIADVLRTDLAVHRLQVNRFKQAIQQSSKDEVDHTVMAQHAEEMLAPTLRLVGQLATAYDQIRQQSQALAQYTGDRTDTLTGLGNARALKEHLQMELGGNRACRGDFSLVAISVELDSYQTNTTETEKTDRLVRAANQIQGLLRDSDLVIRYGVDEFVVILPHTRLMGASTFGRRVIETLAENEGLVANLGTAQSLPGDDAQSLLSRADSARYSAKKSFSDREQAIVTVGPRKGTQYLHAGSQIVPDKEDAAWQQSTGDPTTPQLSEQTVAGSDTFVEHAS